MLVWRQPNALIVFVKLLLPASIRNPQKHHGIRRGGVLFLDNEGYLEWYIRLRAGKGGTLKAHYYCGYAFVEMGLKTKAEQEKAIKEVRQKVEGLNNTYGTKFKVPSPDNDGSAKPYMA